MQNLGNNINSNRRIKYNIWTNSRTSSYTGQQTDVHLWLYMPKTALFATSKHTISYHIINILKERELTQNSVVKEYLTTAADGKNYNVVFYSLEMIIAVGYRVRGLRGTQFRQWATEHLTEYLVKGFTMDDERLKNPDGRPDYFDEIFRQVSLCKSADEKDQSTAAMDVIQKIPRGILKVVGAIARSLDRHGRMPASIIATDPYYSSVVLSNLGSIRLHAGYHHLTNWGTTSVFCIIGEIKKRPFYDDDGNVTMRESVDLGLTIDERIADGYYYSKTIRLLRKLLEEPELLDGQLKEEVEY